MRYMTLSATDRDALMHRLAAMPDYLESSFANLSADRAKRSDVDGAFSPVEHVWHLADLEREGFGRRIERLMIEDAPALPDFDGAAIAAARRYTERSLGDGLARFREARLANVATLQAIAGDAWQRSGTQEGVGKVSLCDMPDLMTQHDLSHREEIETWKSKNAS